MYVDPGWYLDNVLAVAEPGISRIGPARSRQGAWCGAVAALLRESAGTPAETAVRVATVQGLVLRCAQARTAGLTSAETRRLIRSGRWSVPRRGVLCPLPVRSDRTDSPHGKAAEVRAAAAALVRPATVVSHESAAAMHGLPVIDHDRRPRLTAVDMARMASRPDVLVRGDGFSPIDVENWFGIPVLSVERTIVDIGRTSGVGAALVAADAALYDRLTTRARLWAARNRAHHRPGVRQAERAIELASPLAESPLESLTRLCLVDRGLPAPELQVEIATSRGISRVDGLYRSERVVIEADGDVKYRGAGVTLLHEKRRQEALERSGFIVVRVSWDDVINQPADVVRRVREALSPSRWPRC